MMLSEILDDRYQGLFEQTAVGVAISDRHTGGFVRVNRKYAEIVGYSQEQLLQMTFREITHPDDLVNDLKKLQMLLDGDIEKYSIDKRFFHKNGSEVWTKLTVKLLEESKEEQNLYIAILEDITERKLLEKDLAEKNSLLEAIILQTSVPTLVVKAPGRELLYINSAALDVAGLERSVIEEDLTKLSTEVKFYKPNGEQYLLDESVIFHALQGVITKEREAIIERPDGVRRWVLGNGMPIKNDKGEIVAAINIFPDITERKQSEEAVRESERRYRLIMEASPDPIVQYDMNGNVLFINPAFTRVFGWTTSELLGKRIPYVPDDKWPETKKMLEMLNKGENFSGFSTSRLDKQGKEIDVVLSWGVWLDQNENPAGSIVILRDVTEDNLLKKQLQQAQKMESLGNLAGGIAHDFNNILSPIIGYSQLLQQEFKPGDRKYDHAGSIFNAGMRASELVNQILTFSRKSDMEMVPVRLQDMLPEVLSLCRSTIPRNIRIDRDISDECSPVMINPTQFHQVVMNLVTNAYHAIGEVDGTISVQLRQVIDDASVKSELDTSDYVMLTISDTGEGIDSDILDSIFDPYFTTKRSGKGTGLGLSIVYGIVKDCSGEIRVDSDIGKGTTFTILFPIVEDELEDLNSVARKKLPTGNEHILLIDDEEDLLAIERALLENLGYRVSGFENGYDAIGEFRGKANLYDLVLTDLTMPHINGVKLTKEILKIRKEIPVILCTGLGQTFSKVEMNEIGIRGFIKKPLTIDKLADLIRAALDEK